MTDVDDASATNIEPTARPRRQSARSRGGYGSRKRAPAVAGAEDSMVSQTGGGGGFAGDETSIMSTLDGVSMPALSADDEMRVPAREASKVPTRVTASLPLAEPSVTQQQPATKIESGGSAKSARSTGSAQSATKQTAAAAASEAAVLVSQPPQPQPRVSSVRSTAVIHTEQLVEAHEHSTPLHITSSASRRNTAVFVAADTSTSVACNQQQQQSTTAAVASNTSRRSANQAVVSANTRLVQKLMDGGPNTTVMSATSRHRLQLQDGMRPSTYVSSSGRVYANTLTTEVPQDAQRLAVGDNSTSITMFDQLQLPQQQGQQACDDSTTQSLGVAVATTAEPINPANAEQTIETLAEEHLAVQQALETANGQTAVLETVIDDDEIDEELREKVSRLRGLRSRRNHEEDSGDEEESPPPHDPRMPLYDDGQCEYYNKEGWILLREDKQRAQEYNERMLTRFQKLYEDMEKAKCLPKRITLYLPTASASPQHVYEMYCMFKEENDNRVGLALFSTMYVGFNKVVSAGLWWAGLPSDGLDELQAQIFVACQGFLASGSKGKGPATIMSRFQKQTSAWSFESKLIVINLGVTLIYVLIGGVVDRWFLKIKDGPEREKNMRLFSGMIGGMFSRLLSNFNMEMPTGATSRTTVEEVRTEAGASSGGAPAEANNEKDRPNPMARLIGHVTGVSDETISGFMNMGAQAVPFIRQFMPGGNGGEASAPQAPHGYD